MKKEVFKKEEFGGKKRFFKGKSLMKTTYGSKENCFMKKTFDLYERVVLKGSRRKDKLRVMRVVLKVGA